MIPKKLRLPSNYGPREVLASKQLWSQSSSGLQAVMIPKLLWPKLGCAYIVCGITRQLARWPVGRPCKIPLEVISLSLRQFAHDCFPCRHTLRLVCLLHQAEHVRSLVTRKGRGCMGAAEVILSVHAYDFAGTDCRMVIGGGDPRAQGGLAWSRSAMHADFNLSGGCFYNLINYVLNLIQYVLIQHQLQII